MLDTTPNGRTKVFLDKFGAALSRHYSQFLALQLKARLEGIPTPVYGLQEVHHTA